MPDEKKVTVTRDGAVKRGTDVIGQVRKVMEQGIFSTMLGVSASGGGTPRWYATAADGTDLTPDYGQDTRTKAVRLIEQYTRPPSVDSIRREQAWGMGVGPASEFIAAGLTYQGHSMGVSRYPHEPYWIVDSYMPRGAFMPSFSNGSGTRVTRATILKGEGHALVTGAAIEAGFLPEGTPLVVPSEFLASTQENA
jgi:hypothetical protein